MKVSRMITVVPLVTTCLIVWFGSPVLGGYNSNFCDNYLSKGTKTDIDLKPFFYDDYSVITEAAFIKVGNESNPMVTHQQLYYSKSNKQVVLLEDTPTDGFWVFVDQDSKDCIYKKNDGDCTAEEGDCKETAKTVGFGNLKDGTIVIGSPSERLDYPTNIKKSVSFGSAASRGMKSKRLGVCSYDQDTDETIVTLFHVLDTQAFSKMSQTQNTLISLRRFGSKPGAKTTMRRMDYTGFTKLLPSQLTNGFRFGESACGTVRSSFTSRKPPQPTQRFSFIAQEFATDYDDLIHAKFIQSSQVEYNLDSQLSNEVHEVAVGGQNEKDTIVEVEDFPGGVYYKFSATNGECNVSLISEKEGTDRQDSSVSFWQLDAPNSTYLGVYNNRDIPCDLWAFDGDGRKVKLYTATSDWLFRHNYDKDFFYPVQRIDKGELAIFTELYGFKDNPGYHIPYLPSCFQKSDVLQAEVTVMINFQKDIVPKFVNFQYEFRTAIKKITGIKSDIRIASISPAPSQSAPDTETIVAFNIFGKLVGLDDPRDVVYRKDPITTQQALERFRNQVDGGNLKFKLDDKTLSVKFKKGSLAISKSGKNYRYVDSGSGSGYSSGTMAGVSLTLLVVCLALGLAAVFGYKRWTEGAGGGSSVGMRNLQEEI